MTLLRSPPVTDVSILEIIEDINAIPICSSWLDDKLPSPELAKALSYYVAHVRRDKSEFLARNVVACALKVVRDSKIYIFTSTLFSDKSLTVLSVT